MLQMQGVILCALVVAVLSTPIENNQLSVAENSLGLHLITVSMLEGEFRDETGGIYFRVEVSKNFSSIDVATLDGKVILSSKYPSTPDSITFVSLLGEEFVVLSNSNGDMTSLIPYSVPNELQKQVEEDIHWNTFTKDMVKYLNHENIEEKESEAVKLLILRPEIELMFTAAVALQNSKEVKPDSLAALLFYDIALQLKIAKAQLLEFESDGGPDGARVQRTADAAFIAADAESGGQCPNGKCRKRGKILWGAISWDKEVCCESDL